MLAFESKRMNKVEGARAVRFPFFPFSFFAVCSFNKRKCISMYVRKVQQHVDVITPPADATFSAAACIYILLNLKVKRSRK